MVIKAEFVVGETITMKKQHPCGGKEWEIVGTGADIKLRCKTCGRYVTLSREDVRKRSKAKNNTQN